MCYEKRTSLRATDTLTIPARRPIKPVYIRALVALADRFRDSKDEQ